MLMMQYSLVHHLCQDSVAVDRYCHVGQDQFHPMDHDSMSSEGEKQGFK